MKKYYAKYLPIEGNLEIGDITFWDSNEGYFSKQFVRVSESFINHAYGCRWKKYELFICSRDIQIGDHAMELLTTGEYDTFQIDTENDIYDDMIADKKQFKVIGKVSKEALWVKDGDEFDDDELIANGYGVNWNKDGDRNGFLYTLKIKGPCGHFH